MATIWRDRLQSNQTSPSNSPPQSRLLSPAPQRGPSFSSPSLPLRPPVNPRSVSLTSLANESSLNIPNLSRLPNGSALRNEVRPATPADILDPTQVLEGIIGKSSRKSRAADARSIAKPQVLISEIDFGGLSLEDYAAKEEEESNKTTRPIDQRISQTLEEYTKEKDQFEDLHNSITACDKVLVTVETYLQGFQADLGTVSAEIETLQSRSTEMNTRLENRRVVEKLLGPAVQDISISPLIVRKIAAGPIDETWSRALTELEKRAKLVETRRKDSTTKIQAIEDILPLLENLRNRAIERIRDHLVSQIKALRSPNINAQIIQQTGFTKYKDLFGFLAKHQPQLADEISQAYINTMRWYYLQHFTRYDTAVRTIKLHAIDKNDTLGTVDDPSARRNKPGYPATYDAFSLGRRAEILKSTSGRSTTALSTYLIEEDKTPHFIEHPFHTLNLALIDNATSEFQFLTTFFSGSKPFAAITRSFDAIFIPTFQLAQSLTKSLIEGTSDALGLLLCVRLNQGFAFEAQRRRCSGVDGYINATSMALWPRFQQVMDLHCESLRGRAGSAAAGVRSTLSATALLTGGSSSTAAAAQSSAPHPVTQRFANLLAGLVSLSSIDTGGGEDVEPVSNSLLRLRTDFEALLTRLSKGAGDARKRERFLFNNYSLVCTILEGSGDRDEKKGKLAGDVVGHFEGLRDAYSGK